MGNLVGHVKSDFNSLSTHLLSGWWRHTRAHTVALGRVDTLESQTSRDERNIVACVAVALISSDIETSVYPVRKDQLYVSVVSVMVCVR